MKLRLHRFANRKLHRFSAARFHRRWTGPGGFPFWMGTSSRAVRSVTRGCGAGRLSGRCGRVTIAPGICSVHTLRCRESCCATSTPPAKLATRLGFGMYKCGLALSRPIFLRPGGLLHVSKYLAACQFQRCALFTILEVYPSASAANLVFWWAASSSWCPLRWALAADLMQGACLSRSCSERASLFQIPRHTLV